MKSCFRSVSLGVCVLFCFVATSAFSQQDDQLSPTFLQAAGAKTNSKAIAPVVHNNGQAHARFGIFGIDSVPNWNGHFFAAGVDSNGVANNEWYTNTVGNPPNMHGTTVINAPLIPVKLDLRNADGTRRFVNGQRSFMTLRNTFLWWLVLLYSRTPPTPAAACRPNSPMRYSAPSTTPKQNQIGTRFWLLR